MVWFEVLKVCFIVNIDIVEVIPFSLIDIINYFNLLECGVLAGVILISVSEDDFFSLSTANNF